MSDKRRPMIRTVLMLALAGLVPAASMAQDTHRCASIVDPAGRLACYDDAFPPSPEVVEAATEQARADFGLAAPRASLRSPADAAQQHDPESIESRVTRVDHGGGSRTFHLENGQVWSQTESRSTGHVRAGEMVRLRKAVLSGFTLVTPDGVALRVRRVR